MAAGRRGSRQVRRADDAAYGAGRSDPFGHIVPQTAPPRCNYIADSEALEAAQASHTSFYTDAVAKDKYDTLEEVPRPKMCRGVLWAAQ